MVRLKLSSMPWLTRYAGEDLGPVPHIVVLGSCKVGNFVVSTPVLCGLRNRFPDAVIGFVGSDVTADFERAIPQLDWRCSWDDPSPGAGFRLLQVLEQQRSNHGDVQLALNLDGFNPVTCSLVPWLEPRYVAGGSLNQNRRRDLAWGDHPRQRFWLIQTGTILSYSLSRSLQHKLHCWCFASWRGFMTVIPGVFHCQPLTLVLMSPILIHCTTARATDGHFVIGALFWMKPGVEDGVWLGW